MKRVMRQVLIRTMFAAMLTLTLRAVATMRMRISQLCPLTHVGLEERNGPFLTRARAKTKALTTMSNLAQLQLLFLATRLISVTSLNLVISCTVVPLRSLKLLITVTSLIIVAQRNFTSEVGIF